MKPKDFRLAVLVVTPSRNPPHPHRVARRQSVSAPTATRRQPDGFCRRRFDDRARRSVSDEQINLAVVEDQHSRGGVYRLRHCHCCAFLDKMSKVIAVHFVKHLPSVITGRITGRRPDPDSGEQRLD
jgi:hypothetical protein